MCTLVCEVGGLQEMQAIVWARLQNWLVQLECSHLQLLGWSFCRGPHGAEGDGAHTHRLRCTPSQRRQGPANPRARMSKSRARSKHLRLQHTRSADMDVIWIGAGLDV